MTFKRYFSPLQFAAGCKPFALASASELNQILFFSAMFEAHHGK
jgi:hypothetical protein